MAGIDRDRSGRTTEPIGSSIASTRVAIVAIETVWAEEGVGSDQPEALYRRLEFIKQGFTAQAGPLDVLNVHALPGGAMRVDLATRTLIALERRITDELAEPPALSHP